MESQQNGKDPFEEREKNPRVGPNIPHVKNEPDENPDDTRLEPTISFRNPHDDRGAGMSGIRIKVEGAEPR